MKILDRYIIHRLSTIGFFSILVFTLSWLAPEIMFKAIRYIARDTLTLEEGLAYLFYQMPEVLIYCFPISILVATVFLFRQLSLSGELTAILSSGIAFKRLMLPVGIVGLIVAVLFFCTQEWVTPWAAQKQQELNRLKHFNPKDIVEPQVTFVEKSSHGAMQKFVLISPKAIDSQSQFIFLFYDDIEGSTTRINRIITAKKGVWNNKFKHWELNEGIDYKLDNEGIYSSIKSFDSLDIKTNPVAHALLSFPTGNPSEFKLKELEKYARLLIRSGQTEDAKFYEVRMFQRYFLPLTPLLLAILGAYIGIERSRSKRNLGLIYSAVLLLFYNILVPVSTTLGSIGILPAIIAAFMPVVMTVAGGGVIIRLRRLEG